MTSGPRGGFASSCSGDAGQHGPDASAAAPYGNGLLRQERGKPRAPGPQGGAARDRLFGKPGEESVGRSGGKRHHLVAAANEPSGKKPHAVKHRRVDVDGGPEGSGRGPPVSRTIE